MADCDDRLDWCAGGHRCSPALGEHRSEPWLIRTRWGSMVATRVRHRGRDRVELRLLVDLPPDPARGREMFPRVLLGVDRAVRRVLSAVRV